MDHTHPEKKKDKSWIWSIIAVVAICALLILVAFHYTNDRETALEYASYGLLGVIVIAWVIEKMRNPYATN